MSEVLLFSRPHVPAGVLLAVLEKAGLISAIYGSSGATNPAVTSAGTVSAAYQNFLICVEMFFASLALKYAFPYRVYVQGCRADAQGRSVTMQSISSSLKVSLALLVCFAFLCSCVRESVCAIRSENSL